MDDKRRPGLMDSDGLQVRERSSDAAPASTRAVDGHGARVLLVSEGSGGHLIPAMEVASELSRSGASVSLLFAQRRQTGELFRDLLDRAASQSIAAHAVNLSAWRAPSVFGAPGSWAMGTANRLRQTGLVWRMAERELSVSKPHVVVGFGGAFCLPVLATAKRRGVATMIHEQNVTFGQANRWLARWVDRVALSFPLASGVSTPAAPRKPGIQPTIMTGLPVRDEIGRADRDAALARFGFKSSAPTVLIAGGSQGARAINRLGCDMVDQLFDGERSAWQFIHLTGAAECEEIRARYTAAGVTRAWIMPHTTDMAAAYAAADIVVCRSGASTLAELARCAKPAVLIPYPHANSHQRENARLVESTGAGIRLDESSTVAAQLADVIRRLFSDVRLRTTMAERMRKLARPDATQQLARAILELAGNNPGSLG